MLRKIFRFLVAIFGYPAYISSLIVLLPVYAIYYGITKAWRDFENL